MSDGHALPFLRLTKFIVIGLSVNTGGETQKAMLQAGAVALLPEEAAVEELYQMIQSTTPSH